ncbi:MAG TPA: hypothetical protein VFB67_06660, partial [Candidatus Polarisedimenticolaceae bacterium]|nr:hypothetical protein [Candidatus Polarisedimenticolaceae bacterium]
MTKRTWILGGDGTTRGWSALLSVALAGMLVAAPALAAGGAIAETLENVADDLLEITGSTTPNTMVDVIVGSEGPLSAQDQLRIQAMIASLGGTVTKSSFTSFNGYCARVPAGKVPDLAHDADSKHVAPNRHVRPTMDVALPTIGGSNPPAGSPSLLDLLAPVMAATANAPTYTGKNVTVAVIDSGIGSHADLKTPLGV